MIEKESQNESEYKKEEPQRDIKELQGEIVERLYRVQELIRRSWSEWEASEQDEVGDWEEEMKPHQGPEPPARPGEPGRPPAPMPPHGPGAGPEGPHPAFWLSPHRGQGRILAMLSLKPDISQRDLGYMLNMSRQALGELLTKLEKTGQITRHTSSQDHRVMNVHLTEQGHQEAERLKERQYNYGGLFDNFSETELETLDLLLGQIIDSQTRRHPDEDQIDRQPDMVQAEQDREEDHHLPPTDTLDQSDS